MAHKILIVSDDRPMSTALKEALMHDGHLVMTTSLVSTGLHGYDIDRFDLVFLEVSSRDESSAALLQSLKKRQPDIPIVGLVAAEDTCDGLTTLFEFGLYDTLAVPKEIAYRLRPLIRRALDTPTRVIEKAEKTSVDRPQKPAQADRRVAQPQGMMHIMAESPTLNEGAPKLLHALMTSFGWSGGILWIADQQAEMCRCLASVTAPNVHLAASVLPKPAQMADQANDLTTRVRTAKRYHIDRASAKAGSGAVDRIGFPILSNDVVLGLFEFVHPKISEPDLAQIRFMAEIGRQAGMFIERERLENQVRESQKMKAIGRMAGSIAHDFNNILMTIIGRASLLARKFDPQSEEYGHLHHIKEAGDRAAKLIEQLLAFNRSQTMRLERMPFDDIVKQLGPMIHQSLTENMTLELNLEAQEEQVLMDRTQIDQVVMNLSVNARDAMPNGGTLSLRTRLVQLNAHEARLHGLVEGAFIRVDIKDTGQGMEEKVQAHIFEPFFTTKKDKGNGLGLATVYNLVTQNGGTIQVSSQIGRGTAFSIYLPVLQTRSQRPSRPKTPEKQKPAPPSISSKPGLPAEKSTASSAPTSPESDVNTLGTILVIDDEDEVRNLIHSMLEQDGYRLLVASSGQQALGMVKAENKPIDLVISDLIMPDMNGVETVERIHQRYPEVPVLYISGMGDDTLYAQDVVAGGPIVLKKPFSPQVLKQHIHEALSVSVS